MDEQKEYIELETRRCMVYIPMDCYTAVLTADCVINGDIRRCRMELDMDAVLQAKRKALDGYVGDMPQMRDDGHLAMVEIPVGTVGAELQCFVRSRYGKKLEIVSRLGVDETAAACHEASRYYIDEDDRFVLTDYGRSILEGTHDEQ